MKIYDQKTGKLAGQELVNLLDALGKELSGQAKNYTFALDDGLAKALSELDSLLSRLPSSFLDYLDISIPQDFSFSISVTDEGTCQCDLSTDTPIKALYPTIGPLGPQLNGITLRGFSVGEMFGGAVIPVRIDADLHQFNLPTLIAALAIPQDSHLPLPDAKNIVTKLAIHNLFMLVIYETVFPFRFRSSSMNWASSTWGLRA